MPSYLVAGLAEVGAAPICSRLTSGPSTWAWPGYVLKWV